MEAEELSSGESEDALVVTSTPAPFKEPVSEQTAESMAKAPSKSRSALPAGWAKVKSKSKPGAHYYAHLATGKTQVERPVTMYEGLPEPDEVAKPAVPQSVRETLQAVATEATEQRQLGEVEVEVAQKKAQEEANRRRRADAEARRIAENEAKAASAAAEEVMRQARERRASKLSQKDLKELTATKEPRVTAARSFDERGKPRGIAIGQGSKQTEADESSSTEELDLDRLRKEFAERVNKESRDAAIAAIASPSLSSESAAFLAAAAVAARAEDAARALKKKHKQEKDKKKKKKENKKKRKAHQRREKEAQETEKGKEACKRNCQSPGRA